MCAVAIGDDIKIETPEGPLRFRYETTKEHRENIYRCLSDYLETSESGESRSLRGYSG